MFQQIIGFVFGIPATPEERATALRNVVGDLDPMAGVDRLRDAVQHNTEKAGALLAAQGIFAVADTFALDHGWPQLPVLLSLGCMITGSFLAMSILRSTMRMYRHKAQHRDPVPVIFNMLLSRMIRFNSALYLTFASIVLLGIAALRFV